MAGTSINSAAISGNLTRDAELREYGEGNGVLRFSVAVNERRKNGQTGEWEDCPSFIDCVMFGKRTPRLAEWLTRGKRVCVQGRLRQDRWESEGQRRSKVEVVVDELVFMSQADGGDGRGRGQAVEPDLYETDVPF